MDWVNGFIIPIIEIIFIGGISITILYFVGKGFLNAWNKSWKFIYTYKILKTKYPEDAISWIYDCMENKWDRYKVKKILFMNNISKNKINEMIWLYDQISMEIYKEQNGGKINGREFKRSYSKNESRAEQLPSISKE